MPNTPSFLGSLIGMKCPNCRKGKMFTQKSVFPFKKMLDMPERCTECGQKMEIEPGFYYGTGYVSYGLSIALTVFNLVWFLIFIGISFKNNSLFWFIGVDVAIVILLQPWIMRYSRVVYLSMFVKYGSYEKHEEQTVHPAEDAVQPDLHQDN